MSSPVCSALGIDLDDISGKLVAIAEHHGSDANFVLSCLIAERIQKKSGICLLALHNTFGHYHNVGMKLGYNLQQLKEKKSVQTIELLKLVSNIHNDSREINDERFDILAENKEDIVKKLFFLVKILVDQLQTANKSVCLVIDDISDLLTWGIPVKEVCSFLQYCRTFLYEVPGFSLVVLSHFIMGEEDNLILMSGLIHMADITATVKGLKTGCSADVSGTLTVTSKNITHTEQWNKQNFYHFKLYDKQVKLFAPGTLS